MAAPAPLAVLAGTAGPAHGHARLHRSDPAPGVVVPADQPPRRMSLWFTEPVGVGPGAVVLLDSQERRVGTGAARVAPDDPRRIDLDPGPLPPGAYAVRWRVNSGDTHVVRGTYWFIVAFANAPPPVASLLGSRPPPVPALETLSRWLGLLAVLALAGAPFWELLVLAPILAGAPPPRAGGRTLLSLAGIFLVAQALGAAAQVEALAGLPFLQALDAETARVALFDSRFAALWWARLLLDLVLVALLLKVRDARWAAGTAALLLVATALAGHAVGGRGPRAVTVAADTLHLAAAALWLGGLVQLALWLRNTLRSASRARPPEDGRRTAPRALLAALVSRFSTVALASVLVLVLSGAVNASVQIGSLTLLLRTAYGQTLLLKLALLFPLLAIAAVNRWVLRPRLAAGHATTDDRLPGRLRRLITAEIALVTGVLLVVGLLGSLPPPAATALPAPVEATRQAGPLRVTLRVDPNWVGVSRFRVTLADEAGRPPADVRQVILTFTMEGMNMGRTHVTLTPSDGGYEAVGFYIGMPGVSQVGVGIGRRDAADQSAVFRLEVPDVNATQFVGLRALLAGEAFASTKGIDSAHGRAIYGRHCAVCHGDDGTGTGPAAPSLLPPPADLTLHARWHSDEQLLWFVSHGVAGTSMIGFGDRLAARDRHNVVGYLRVLAAAPTATPARTAPPLAPTPVVPPTPETAAPAAPPPTPAVPEPAPAGPGLSGRLVFGPDFDNNLWLLNLPDGKPAPLTCLGPLEFSSNPAWSPDGRRIAFSYYRLPGGDAIPVPEGTDLYVMNADGGGVRPLAIHDVPGAALQYPAWSADHAAVYVSYVRQGGAELAIDRVSVASGARTRVVVGASFPSPSRDGRRLAWIRFATPPARGQSLWWSAPDGSGAQPIVGPDVFDKLFGVRFAPDGRRVVFAAVGRVAAAGHGWRDPLGLLRWAVAPRAARANGDLWEMWTVDLDGRNLRPLTTLSEDLPVGAWSPDGTHVAFLGGGSASTAEAGLAVVRADGSGLLRLTTQPGHRGLDWAPAAAVGARRR